MTDDKTIKIGRREVLLDDFKTAVAQSNSPRGVCRSLDFNDKVTSTVNAIKATIDNLELDTAHFKPAYTISDKVKNRARVKQFNLSNDNEKYYVAFQGSINPASWSTYKATIGNFMESLGDKDFATVSVDEILGFVGDKENRSSHLKSLMIYIVKNNVSGAVDKVGKDVLVWMINETQSKVLISEPVYPDEIKSSNAKTTEGSVDSTTINVHERNPIARRICLEYYGVTCSVCEKELGEIYGDLFSGKIHVHHLAPISKYDKEHDVDPINDLRPVCPNCHMIIHCRKDSPYSIEEAKAFML